MKKHFFNKNLAGFASCIILVYLNVVRTNETLLTYDLRIRKAGPHFHFVLYYKKHFRPQMKNAVSYKLELTVLRILFQKYLILDYY